MDSRAPFTTPVMAVLALGLGTVLVATGTWRMYATAPDWLIQMFRWLLQSWWFMLAIGIGWLFASLGMADLKRRVFERGPKDRGATTGS